MFESKRYTYLCGCILITEPLSFYQWYPCKIHTELDMCEVLDALPENEAVEEVLTGPELTIYYV